MREPRSFEHDDRHTVTDTRGQRAHEAHVAQSARLARRFSAVGSDAWTLVGNGLSNQSFVRGPEGIIAIDTGESIEEMRAALAELRAVTDEPIVAVLLTHFHYVTGTQAVLDEVAATRGEAAAAALPIWGHAKINANRNRAGGEIGPAYTRGLVEQFAIVMPTEGEDGTVNVGLGLAWHNAEHAPFTQGYLPPNHTFDADTHLRIAGLDVEVTLAPSDADDSVTYWFPALGLAVHNLVWPVLFNVYAIRGEEYRDPRILLTGSDHLRSLGAEHLIATHGPPLSGPEVGPRVTRARDAIQFLWDQTVRHTNRGATGPELAHLVVLPDSFDEDHLTAQLYGVAEHHTRQIRSGLFGFFDGDPAQLFPHAPAARAERMIDAMGGVDAVRGRARDALAAGELRSVAQPTTAANIRNWCITRARDLEGTGDLSRFNQHRFSRGQVLHGPVEAAVHPLRVLLEPDRLVGVDLHLAVVLDGETTGLHLRNHVGVPTDGSGADTTITTTRATWAEVLTGRRTFDDALTAGEVTIAGDGEAAVAALRAVDLPGFA